MVVVDCSGTVVIFSKRKTAAVLLHILLVEQGSHAVLEKYWISKSFFKTMRKYWIRPKCTLST